MWQIAAAQQLILEDRWDRIGRGTTMQHATPNFRATRDAGRALRSRGTSNVFGPGADMGSKFHIHL